MTPTVPLSFLVRQTQREVADAIADWFDQLTGVWGGPRGPRNDSNWQRSHQEIGWDGGYALRLLFDFTGFDPDRSHWEHGPERISDESLVTLVAHSYLFDNRGGSEPLDIDLSEAVTYHQSRSTSTTSRIKLDIGSKTTGTIGGDDVGAKLEQEISASLGIETDTSTAEENSTDRTQTQSIRTKVRPGRALLASIETPRVDSARDFAVDGWIAGPLTVSFASRAFGAGGVIPEGLTHAGPNTTYAPYSDSDPDARIELRFESFDDFLSLLAGTNVDFGGIERDISHGRSDAIDDARRLRWSGVIRRQYEQSAAYRFTDATSDADSVAAGLAGDHVVRAA